MSESKAMVFPVPHGISSTQCPWKRGRAGVSNVKNAWLLTPHAHLSIQTAFQIQHIGILLRVDVVVGKHYQ